MLVMSRLRPIATRMFCLTWVNFSLFCFLTTGFSSGAPTPESKRERCFTDPPIGCFSNQPPFDNVRQLPQSPDFINVHYSISSQDETTVVSWRQTDIFLSTFELRPGIKTVFIIHGFLGKVQDSWVQNMTRAILDAHGGAVNVIAVDWSRGSSVHYSQSVSNIRVASAIVARFIQELIAFGTDPASVHLIGFSLGAHLAGAVGQRVAGIGRITGLDPAARKLENSSPKVRLDPTDAEFVDVIHTDGAQPFGFGSTQPMGLVDLYANGGLLQPGCSDNTFVDFVNSIFFGKSKCSHCRARDLFMETVRSTSCTMMAGRCSSVDSITRGKCSGCRQGDLLCVPVGYHAELSKTMKGLYSFRTDAASPYCQATVKGDT